jgi:hypothetical protein
MTAAPNKDSEVVMLSQISQAVPPRGLRREGSICNQ